MARYYADHARREQLAVLEILRDRMAEPNGDSSLRPGDRPPHRRPASTPSSEEPYVFDRRFLFRVLSMGHSQFAELIGARGPNTQINCGLREHDASRLAGGGLDPRRPLPPRDHRLGGRHHVRPPDRMVRRRLPRQRRGGDRRRRRRSGDSVRPAASRPDHGDGRRGPGGGERRSRRASAAFGRSARCSSTVTANSAFHGTPPRCAAHRPVMEKLIAAGRSA